MVPIGFRFLYSRTDETPIGFQEVRVMPQVMVRYTVKPDRVAENEQLVRAVYDELAATKPEGLQYATFKLPDGVTFVHVAQHAEVNPLRMVAAFQSFQEAIRDRCDEPPVATELEEIGSYRFFEAAR
jgi:hypothetical protein